MGFLLSADAVFERYGALIVPHLLLAELFHDSLPAWVLLKMVRVLRIDDVTQAALLFLAELTLLRCKFIKEESIVRSGVHVINARG